MSDIRPNIPMEELILRYLSGETSESEFRELEAWVLADPDNKAFFTEMKKVWMLSGMGEKSDVDVENEWRKLEGKTGFIHPSAGQAGSSQRGSVVRMRPGRMFLRIAAAVIVLVMAGTVVYQLMLQDEMEYLAGNTVENIRLADGSTVILNRESALTWGTKAKDQRNVSLKGDAYFEVTRDEAKPFVITAGDVEVEVLGTAFYVDAREEHPFIDITVESGRVAVRSVGTEIVLNAGEKAAFHKQAKTLQQRENTDPNFNSLKSGTLAFENSRLDKVADALNRHYHAQIVVEPSVQETCELTATFQDKSLDAIMQIMSSTIDIDIVRQNQQIILRGSCKLN